jgi:very-short-patch-repair endonuclease
MVDKPADADARIAAVAARQHGVVTLAQLESAGLSRAAVSQRATRGRLHRVHRGVYAVGHPGLSLHGRWMAGVLALGEAAVLSHLSAAVLWGLLRPSSGPIHVSVPGDGGRDRRRGLLTHRRVLLLPERRLAGLSTEGIQSRQPPLVTVRDRIPVTSVARTVRDLRGTVAPYLVRRAIRQAEMMGMRLEGVESDGTRSDLERAFLCLCQRHGLPRPEVNVRIGRWTVDFLWREERLAVETDGFAYHRGSVAFERDHARDLDLRSRGYAVLRFTGRQVEEEPARVAADVAAALAAAASVSGKRRG